MISSRKWPLIIALFINEILLMGGIVNTFGVFFVPLMHDFHWSHAQVAFFHTVLFLTMAATAPLAGWLFEKFENRLIMTVGIIMCAGAFLLASQATSYAMMIAAFMLVGAGMGLSTMLAIAVVVGKSFDETERGTALGVAMSGNGAGGFFMLPVASFAVAWLGWRSGYLVLAAPMILISIPLILWFVRSGPGKRAQSHVSVGQEGLEVGEALRTRAFWMIILATFLFVFALGIPVVHVIPYLIHIGYQPTRAADSMGIIQGITCAGTIIWGSMVDRFSARMIMMTVSLIGAVSMMIVLKADQVVFLFAFILIFGSILNAVAAVMPLLMAESLGMKRYPFFSGLGMATLQVAFAVGPFIGGWIVDVTGTYSGAFIVAAVAAVAASVLTAAIPAPHYKVAGVPLHA